MEVRRWRIGNTEVVRAVKENAMHMVVKRNSCTASMDRTVSMDRVASMDRTVSMNRMASMDRMVSMDSTVSMGGTASMVSMDSTVSMGSTVSMDRTVSADRTDVAVAECMEERGVTEKEQEERFRLILMPRGPRGCMLGCENADTTCFIGRGHTSARNAC